MTTDFGIRLEERSNRVIAYLSGEFSAKNAHSFKDAVSVFLHTGGDCSIRPLVLDMSEVKSLDDSCLKILQELYQRAEECLPYLERGVGLVRVANPSIAVQDVLHEAGVLQQFTGWQTRLWTMTPPAKPSDGYPELLERVRRAFPTPVSDPIHDAYLTQTIAKALDHLDSMKHNRPFLGERVALDYDSARTAASPEGLGKVEDVIKELASYMEGLVIWGHPLTQENVIPPGSIPSLVGHLLSVLGNPNIIWDEYSHKVGEAEVEASAMCSRLVGYDPEEAAGIFTWGGTGTTFYGLRLAIEKAEPEAFANGVRSNLKLISSDASHYCKLNALGWLGVGYNNLVTVPTDQDNAMDLVVLEETMRSLLDAGETIACILPTMGTTDAFGIDNLQSIVEIRDRLAKEYGLENAPHIHADAVIGWAWSVFNDYDFTSNPLRFADRTLRSLWDVRERIRHLHLADSIGIDFHKTGYAPYLSSLFLCKNRKDLDLLSRDKALMPYLYQFGSYHPGVFTMESSRPAGPAMAALANLKFFGKQGYRTLLGHGVTMAEALRAKLEQAPFACVVNDYNHGPVTLFRIYPDGVDPRTAYAEEVNDPAFSEQLKRHNDYNRAIFAKLREHMEQGVCLALSLTDRYRATPAGEPVLALKSYAMSPFIDEGSMDQLLDCLAGVRDELKESYEETAPL